MSEEKIELFDFEKLKVYQKSLDFVDYVYQLSKTFPQNEQYGITSQFKRAAYSISLNIGEGSAGSRKEFIQFLTISFRSMRECVVCTTICSRQKYIDQKTEIQLRNKLIEISKMISGLIKYLESNQAKNNLSEPTEDYLRTTNYELPTR
jgi:four helix bundle protein